MIVAAAIRHEGKVYALPAPARHADVGWWMIANDICKAPFPSGEAQGFIDSTKGFVGRIEARDIALHVSKQITKADHPRDLFSEDVW